MTQNTAINLFIMQALEELPPASVTSTVRSRNVMQIMLAERVCRQFLIPVDEALLLIMRPFADRYPFVRR